jgi:ABC-type molybdate transport system substrate-binding protein
MKLRIILLALGLAVSAAAAGQRVLRLGVHPALAETVRQIAAEYQKAHKAITFEFLSLSSDKADMLLGPFEEESARLFALNRLVLVTLPENDRVAKLAHIGLDVKLAVPDPKTIEGALAAQVISTASDTYGRDWEANVKKNGSVKADGSAEAVGLVMEGKADAALVLSSDAAPRKEKLRVIPLPPDLGRAAEMKAWVRDSSSLAEGFREYLFTKGNQQRLVAAGFASPLSPVAELSIMYPGSMMKLFTAALGTLKQEKLGSLKGTSLRAVLTGKGSQVKFLGADGVSLTTSLASIRRSGGVIAPMGDGNYQVVLPGRKLRWVRRIVVS